MAFFLPEFKSVAPNERRAKRMRDGLKKVELAVLPDEPPEAERVPFLEAKACHCKWPYGTKLDTKFCGQPTITGSSWCEYHIRRALPPRLAEEIIRRRLAVKAGWID